MKRFISTLFAVVAMFCLSTVAFAQNPFEGKWRLNASTPIGETVMDLTLTNTDGNWTGVVSSEGSTDTMDAEDVKVTDTTLSFAIFAQGYDVAFNLDLKEDGTVSGTMMGQFPVDGKKVEE